MTNNAASSSAAGAALNATTNGTTNGTSTPVNKNPYIDQLAKSNSPALLSEAYELHRTTRNADKLAQLTQSPTVSPDPILRGLVIDNQPPEFDHRNCITVWVRPTAAVMDLVQSVQRQLVEVLDPENLLPSTSDTVAAAETTNNVPLKSNTGPLWVMPRDCLHMTALEIVHSEPEETIQPLLASLKPHITKLVHGALNDPPTLFRPKICFDAAALALTFIPNPKKPVSYTHYRAKLFDTVVNEAGIPVDSRYQVPSAHITIARFIDQVSPDKLKALLAKAEELNGLLAASDLEWTIGDERPALVRSGRIWYGGGRTETSDN